jgi:hypothetical protein
LKPLFSRRFGGGRNRLFGRSSILQWGSLAALKIQEKTGGFQPVGAVDFGHPGYETAATCIID